MARPDKGNRREGFPLSFPTFREGVSELLPGSVYIVRTRNFGLFTAPLLLESSVRSLYSLVLGNPKCYSDFYVPVHDSDGALRKLPPLPYIHGIGELGLRIHGQRIGAERLETTGAFNRISQQKGDSTRCTLDQILFSDCSWHTTRQVFGYNPLLEDERLNFLPFQLIKPLKLRATQDGVDMATASLYIHLFPLGYVELVVAISLGSPCMRDEGSLAAALAETKPWLHPSSWTWKARIGSGQLADILDKAIYNIQYSIFEDKTSVISDANWWSVIRAAPGNEVIFRTIAPHPWSQKQVEMDLRPKDVPNVADHEQKLLLGDGATHLVLDSSRRSVTSLRAVWDIHRVLEFAHMKRRIYQDIGALLVEQTSDLRHHRLDKLTKLGHEKLMCFTVYDPSMNRLQLALDSHILSAKPFYRKVYAHISDRIGLNEERKRCLRAFEEWIEEVGKWSSLAELMAKGVKWLLPFAGG